ncbi:hypothetical protein EIK77_001539 [Talaromyces pinophilus]|nr:hypothetical protein EIK77_001539 [Talaromyces pinophilus]PCH01393.1 Transferase [Penicillium occitanis (nom. inval.)]PCH09674.1 hypothetical protein PENOC_009020 [Penicillium occitanis (nom. inval.)]
MELTTYAIRADPRFEAVYQLSPSDLQIPPRAIRQAFIYSTDDQDESKVQSLAISLQESLKTFLKPLSKDNRQTDTTYPQLLGRVVRPKDGSLPHVVVDESSSVPFKVATRLDIDFEKLSPAQRFPDEAIQKADFAIGLDDSELLSQHNLIVQLTFIKGGFVLVVQIHHVITDGYGYAGFMRQWLQRTNTLVTKGWYEENPSMKSTKTSIHDKTELLRDVCESPDAVGELNGLKTWETLYKNAPKISKNPLMGSKEIQSKIFWLSPGSLEKLRAEMHNYTEDRPTIFESITALAWQCLARARTDANTAVDSTTSSGLFAADMRTRLVPPLVTDFFGNAVTAVVARARLSILLSKQHANVATVIDTVQATLRKDTTDRNLRSINRLIFSQLQAGRYVPADLLGQDVLFNSWEHLYPSLRAMEIGVGKFCIMRNLQDAPITPSYVLLLPSYGMRQTSSSEAASHKYQYSGGIELEVHLLRHQMEKLEQDEEWTRYFSV